MGYPLGMHRRRQIAGLATTGMLAGAMIAVFALAVGVGSGTSGRVAHADASQPLDVQSLIAAGASPRIAISSCLVPYTIDGSITLAATASGTITLELLYQVNGNLVDSGQQVTVTFGDTSVAPYSFPFTPVPEARSYAVAIIGPGFLHLQVDRSPLVRNCTTTSPSKFRQVPASTSVTTTTSQPATTSVGSSSIITGSTSTSSTSTTSTTTTTIPTSSTSTSTTTTTTLPSTSITTTTISTSYTFTSTTTADPTSSAV